MSILLTGVNGQVGWELRRTLAPLGKVVATTSRDLDLSNVDVLRARVRELHRRAADSLETHCRHGRSL